MKKIFLIISAMIFSFGIVAQTPVPGGNVSGTWTEAGSPYLIQGNIIIPNGNTLTIQPGVKIEFQGNYNLQVSGRILAVGLDTATILFTASNPETGFNAISFLSTAATNDSSIFDYCRIEHGNNKFPTWPDACGGAIQSDSFNKIRIGHCTFFHNRAEEHPAGGHPSGGAIALGYGASILIQNSTFENNVSDWGGAIGCYMEANPIIRNNIFKNNLAYTYAGAICIADTTSPVITGNQFIENTANGYGGAITLIPTSVFTYINPIIEWNLFYKNHADSDGGAIEMNSPANPLIRNNTFIYNTAGNVGGGIDFYMLTGVAPVITNSIFWGNTAAEGSQVYIMNPGVMPDFYYCDIEGGTAAFGGATFTGEYIFNIDENPLFCDTAETDYDFHLQGISPCRETGDSSCMPATGKRCDMGAYIGDYCDPFPVGNYELRITNYGSRITNWPDPFNQATTFKYTLDEDSQVTIQIYNGFGQKVAEPVNGYRQKGEQTLIWNAGNLPAGIYFYWLQAGKEMGTGKMVKL
jgi:hypothetical protein